MDERDDEYLLRADLVDDAPGVGGDIADLGVIELGHAPAATSEAHSPSLDLASEIIGGESESGVDALQALLDLSEDVELIDDLIEGTSSGSRSMA